MTTPTPDVESMRAQFEAQMRERWVDFSPERHPGAPEEYLKAPEHCAWQGYQAAIQSPAVAGLVEALEASVMDLEYAVALASRVNGVRANAISIRLCSVRDALAPFTGADHE